MPNYYCPYCSSRNFKIKKTEIRNYSCEFCGESLQLIHFIKPTQIISLVVVLGLVSPLLLYAVTSLKELDFNIPNKMILFSEIILSHFHD